MADSLSIPVFITDTEGNLLFYNEPAEEILGKRFEYTGSMPVAEWSVIFKPEDGNGRLLDPMELPLVRTLYTREPAYGEFWIESLDNQKHHLSVTSYPIIGRTGQYVGAMAIFWKNDIL